MNLVSNFLNFQPGHKDKDAEYYRQFDYMSQCIGVGCWVLTTDKKVVFVENAAWKGEQACRVDRPGGHAEPGECPGEDATKLSGAEVRRELFDCIQRELRDEVNIGLEHQSAPELLGVVYNHERGGRLCEINIIISKSSLWRNYLSPLSSSRFPDRVRC